MSNPDYKCLVCGRSCEVETSETILPLKQRTLKFWCPHENCGLFGVHEEYTNRDEASLRINRHLWANGGTGVALMFGVFGRIRIGYLKNSYRTIHQNNPNWEHVLTGRRRQIYKEGGVWYQKWVDEAKVLQREDIFPFVLHHRQNQADSAPPLILVDYLEELDLCPITVETIRKHFARTTEALNA